MKRLNAIKMMVTLVSAAATLSACGGHSQTTSARIGPDGGTLATPGGVSLRLAAGAVSSETEVTVTEQPGRTSSARRVVIEPAGLALAVAATLRVEAGDDSATARLVRIDDSPGGEVEHGIETERHGQDGRSREAEIERFGTFELRHGADDPGTGGCPAGQELEDGACKPHGGAAGGTATGGNGADDPGTGGCPAGQELEDGVCTPHGGATTGGTATGGNGADDPAAPGCPAGFELDASDGVCKPHGGGTAPASAPAPAPAPAPGACPAGWELDASDGVCKPHGGGK